MKKILTIFMLLSVLLLLVACTQTVSTTTDTTTPKVTETSTAATAGTAYQVVIENDKFMPTDLQVQAGDTIEWVNIEANNTVEHTVTFESGDFDQKIPVGGKATYTFKEKGTFGYFCSIHPGMQGTIVVN